MAGTITAATTSAPEVQWVLPHDRPVEVVRSEPEDREPPQFRPHVESQVAAGMVAVVVGPRDEGEDEGQGGQTKGDLLGPQLHATERPREEDQEQNRDDRQGLLQGMQRVFLGLGPERGRGSDGVTRAVA